MSRLTPGRAVAAVIGTAAVVGALLWATPPEPADLGAVILDVDADRGRAADEEGPVVATYGPGDAARLRATLCRPDGEPIAGRVSAALWAAPGRGEWRLVQQGWAWEAADAGCLSATIEGPAAAWWPDTDRGVVRWAVVAGEGADAPLVDGGPTWRERGLLVVDGEAIRVP